MVCEHFGELRFEVLRVEDIETLHARRRKHAFPLDLEAAISRLDLENLLLVYGTFREFNE